MEKQNSRYHIFLSHLSEPRTTCKTSAMHQSRAPLAMQPSQANQSQPKKKKQGPRNAPLKNKGLSSHTTTPFPLTPANKCQPHSQALSVKQPQATDRPTNPSLFTQLLLKNSQQFTSPPSPTQLRTQSSATPPDPTHSLYSAPSSIIAIHQGCASTWSMSSRCATSRLSILRIRSMLSSLSV